MRVDNYGFLHPAQEAKMDRINEIFHWIVTLDAFDYCDPEPLRTLLDGKEPIPEEVRPAIAKIVAGERTPNRRAAAKLKVPAAERMKIAGSLSAVLGLIDLCKYEEIVDQGCIRRAIDVGADRNGDEPIDELRRLQAEAAQLIVGTAGYLGVSVETVENLLRDLRKKMEKFPDV